MDKNIAQSFIARAHQSTIDAYNMIGQSSTNLPTGDVKIETADGDLIIATDGKVTFIPKQRTDTEKSFAKQ